jgi:hypothetical protein
VYFRKEYRFNSLSWSYSIWIMIFMYQFSLTWGRESELEPKPKFHIPALGLAPAKSFGSGSTTLFWRPSFQGFQGPLVCCTLPHTNARVLLAITAIKLDSNPFSLRMGPGKIPLCQNVIICILLHRLPLCTYLLTLTLVGSTIYLHFPPSSRRYFETRVGW